MSHRYPTVTHRGTSLYGVPCILCELREPKSLRKGTCSLLFSFCRFMYPLVGQRYSFFFCIYRLWCSDLTFTTIIFGTLGPLDHVCLQFLDLPTPRSQLPHQIGFYSLSFPEVSCSFHVDRFRHRNGASLSHFAIALESPFLLFSATLAQSPPSPVLQRSQRRISGSGYVKSEKEKERKKAPGAERCPPTNGHHHSPQFLSTTFALR